MILGRVGKWPHVMGTAHSRPHQTVRAVRTHLVVARGQVEGLNHRFQTYDANHVLWNRYRFEDRWWLLLLWWGEGENIAGSMSVMGTEVRQLLGCIWNLRFKHYWHVTCVCWRRVTGGDVNFTENSRGSHTAPNCQCHHNNED